MRTKQIAIRLTPEAIEALAELRAYLRVRNPDARIISEATAVSFALRRAAAEGRRLQSDDPRIVEHMMKIRDLTNEIVAIEVDEARKHEESEPPALPASSLPT